MDIKLRIRTYILHSDAVPRNDVLYNLYAANDYTMILLHITNVIIGLQQLL